jgi:hypothetical protein
MKWTSSSVIIIRANHQVIRLLMKKKSTLFDIKNIELYLPPLLEIFQENGMK